MIPVLKTAALASALALSLAGAAMAAEPGPVATAPTYADLATLADGTPVVARVKIAKATPVAAERAPDLRPGFARFYIEAQTLALLTGAAGVPEKTVFLADLPLDAKGKAPKLRKREWLVFARPVAGRADQLQLVAPTAYLDWSQDLETRLRPVLTGYAAANAPPRITGVRDALSSEGNLAGESETQIFLTTSTGAPAALTVVRRPGADPRWGVSWSELIDQSAAAPAAQTLGWYRLACALPASLPPSANAAETPADRARAQQDYRFVLDQLGPCERTLAAAR